MTLIKYSPVKDFENLHSNLMRYFDDFSAFRKSFSDDFSPNMEFTENDKNIVIKAEVPGVDKKDIKISIHDKILIIEGEKRKEKVEENSDYFRSERVFGSFKRQFELPENVDQDKVDAKYENGVLIVELKKRKIDKPKERVIELN